MVCCADSDMNMFVKMKRGGTLEEEWIICYAALVSEVNSLLYGHFGYKQCFPSLSLLCAGH